ncbi:phosphoglycerate mutase-like protein [Infundibulicybe gibba]|nr:phosphoglycerate mutase-like protein [Infundibulicybe gibba]
MTVAARIYIVRHGETDANRMGIIQGQMDTALNENGRKQATLVAEALKSIPFDRAYASDLSRAADTAGAILLHHPELPLTRQEMLRERDMGELQGKVVLPTEWANITPTGTSTIETGTNFNARAIGWWNRWVLQYIRSLEKRDDPYNVLVVTHGGFINTLVRGLVDSRKARYGKGVTMKKCVNCSITVIEVAASNKGIIVQCNDASHMAVSVVKANADEINV